MEGLLQQYARQVNESFAVQDNHIWVVQAIAADLSSGQAKIDDKGELDFKYYYDKRRELLLRMKAELDAKKEPAEPEKKPSEPVAEEFGGDYGKSETGSEDAAGQQDARSPEDVGEGRPSEDDVPPVPPAASAGEEQPGGGAVQV